MLASPVLQADDRRDVSRRDASPRTTHLSCAPGKAEKDGGKPLGRRENRLWAAEKPRLVRWNACGTHASFARQAAFRRRAEGPTPWEVSGAHSERSESGSAAEAVGIWMKRTPLSDTDGKASMVLCFISFLKNLSASFVLALWKFEVA